MIDIGTNLGLTCEFFSAMLSVPCVHCNTLTKIKISVTYMQNHAWAFHAAFLKHCIKLTSAYSSPWSFLALSQCYILISSEIWKNSYCPSQRMILKFICNEWLQLISYLILTKVCITSYSVTSSLLKNGQWCPLSIIQWICSSCMGFVVFVIYCWW